MFQLFLCLHTGLRPTILLFGLGGWLAWSLREGVGAEGKVLHKHCGLGCPSQWVICGRTF
jgi:hypothetical protein